MNKAYKILSWNWFQMSNAEEFIPMIKVHPTFELMESCLRNGDKLRIAINDADQRYNGIYYCTVEMPSYIDPQEPIMYLMLYDRWKGYPIETGYFTVLGEDNDIPTYINKLQCDISNSINDGIYKNAQNLPSRHNMFSRNSNGRNTYYQKLCTK